MNEFSPRSENEPTPETEPTIAELLERAKSEGWIEDGDEEYLGEDLPDILGNLYDYILQGGGDPDDVLARWGVAFEIPNETE